jgi:hypothetical protein
VKATLPWKLPPVLLRDLVAFAVSRINIKRSSAVNSNVCARVRFTGIKPDYRKELSLGFGDYCEVYDGTDNTMRSRTIPCIALYPCCNYTGSWAFCNLLTKTRIRRTHWKKMVTTQDFVEKMNALNPEAVVLEPVGGDSDKVVKDNVENRDGDESLPSKTPDEEPSTSLPDMKMADEDVPDLVDQDEEEIKLVFNDLKAVELVMKEDIPKGFKAHNTHLFTVEKFLADGRHEKYKSRLVAHGNEQDVMLYADRSSPTASIHAIFTCLTVAACNPDYVVGKLDVKGAFIQTEMSGVPVYIQCRGKLKDMILRVRPDLAKYVGKDRVLYGKLLKALYGCVQASRLWYEKLKDVLLGLGYTQSETDRCIFRKIVNERVYLLVVYVDDILIIATNEEIEYLGKCFMEVFR